MKTPEDWQTAFDAMDIGDGSAAELQAWIAKIQEDAQADLIKVLNGAVEKAFPKTADDGGRLYLLGANYLGMGPKWMLDGLSPVGPKTAPEVLLENAQADLKKALKALCDELNERTHPHHGRREASFVGGVVCEDKTLQAANKLLQ